MLFYAILSQGCYILVRIDLHRQACVSSRKPGNYSCITAARAAGFSCWSILDRVPTRFSDSKTGGGGGLADPGSTTQSILQ